MYTMSNVVNISYTNIVTKSGLQVDTFVILNALRQSVKADVEVREDLRIKNACINIYIII